MKKRLEGISESQGFKAATLVVLTLIMLIPVSMVKSLIFERSYRASEVTEEISESAGGPLEFAGPIIKIPGIRRVENVFVNSEGRKNIEYYNEDFSLWFTPEELKISINLDTENKFRGIFYSPVYRGEIRMNGYFDLTGIKTELEDNEELLLKDSVVVIPFFNQKGIIKVQEANFFGRELRLQPGNSGLNMNTGGIQSQLSFEDVNTESVKMGKPFNIRLSIRGAGSVNILPLASSTTAEISADWPAPSFTGFCLPDSHDLNDQGFQAQWNCSSLSSGIPVQWDNKTVFDEWELQSSYIKTGFINIHDHYEQNERAAKYAILFILIPFITLFLFEHFFKRRIHIIQYILAGIANIIFYLLLLSLSEHISFNLSYLIASSAVTVMLCLYTYSMLKGDPKAWFMAPVMIAVYLFLFITLQSEDWSLLIGSAGVFAITAFIMFITRRIDFYQSRQNLK